MTWKRTITLTLWLIACVFIYLSLAEGFNNPNQSKYKTIIRKSKDLQESEIESSRAVNPRRKASENKRPWLADSFLDMENLVFAPFDSTYRGNLEWPKYVWPDGTRHDTRPDEIPLVFAGCILSAPATWDLPTQGNTYLAHINILYGIIREMKIKGPAKVGKLAGLDIPVHVYDNAQDGTVITLTLLTVSVTTEPAGKRYGSCEAKTRITNQPCECVNADPIVYASSATIAEDGGTITLWVDSGGQACPDYAWSVSSGTGHTLDKSITHNDLETVTLTSAVGNCGTHFSATATITATDSCGETSQVIIRNTGGQYRLTADSTYSTCPNNVGTCGQAGVNDGIHRWAFSCSCWHIPFATCPNLGGAPSNYCAANGFELPGGPREMWDCRWACPTEGAGCPL